MLCTLQRQPQRDRRESLMDDRLGDSLFENALDAMLLANDQQQYIEANPAACRLLEYRREELLERSICDISAPPEAVATGELWDAFLKAGMQEGEIPLRTKTGRKITVEYRAVANIQPGVHLSVLRDVTQRKQTEESLRKMASIVEHSDDAILSKSPEGTIVCWNAGAERVYGYSAAEAIGQNIDILYFPDHQGDRAHIRREISNGRSICDFETVLRHKDGTAVDISVTVFPLRDEQGRMFADASIGRDITQRKTAARELAKGEELRRAIVDSLASQVVVIDRRGSIVVVNDAWERFASENAIAPAEVWPGTTYLEVFRQIQAENADEIPQQASAGIRAVLDGRQNGFEMEYSCCFAEDQRWFLLHCSPLQQPDGGAVIAHTNISARKQDELALAASESRYRSLVTATASVVWTANAQGDPDRSLPLWEAYSGQSSQDHRGDGWLQAVYPDDRQYALAAWKKAVQTQNLYRAEYRAWHAPTAQYRHVVARAAPVRDENGNVKEWVGAIIDVDDQKRAQAELQQQRDMMAHLNRRSSISEMAAILAHELNQPLSVIMNYAAPLADAVREASTDPGEVAFILEAIHGQALRAREITRGMRRFAAGKTRTEKNLAVMSLLEDVRQLTHAQLQSHHWRLRVEVAEDVPQITGDRVQLDQVLVNLIQNAVDAMEGTPPQQREILLRAVNEDGDLLISVSDRGKGLSSEQLEQIFESYFTTKPEGVGLGLSICRSIIDAHGGHIRGELNADRGLTFHIRLPGHRSPLTEGDSIPDQRIA